MVTYDTPMRELEDQGVNPADGDNDPRFMIEINPGANEAVIEFREYLEFHANLARSDEEKGYTSAHKWAELVDHNGYLTVASEEKLVVEMSKLLRDNGASGVTVYYASGSEYDDAPSMAMSFVSKYRDGETYGEWTDRIGWPIVATVINVTDPGTFNVPYLFSSILYR